jgi:hypothetical protein
VLAAASRAFPADRKQLVMSAFNEEAPDEHLDHQRFA